MASKNYSVNVDTTVDTKKLDALIKKLTTLKGKVDVGVAIDDKELKNLQKSVADIGKKPVKVNIDVTKTKQDLNTVEKQLDKIAQKSKGIKTPGGGKMGGAGGVGGYGMDPLLMSVGSTDVGDIVAAKTVQTVQQTQSIVDKWSNTLKQTQIEARTGGMTPEQAERTRRRIEIERLAAQAKEKQSIENNGRAAAKAVDTTTQSVKGLTAAVVGNEAIEKVNFLLLGMATNYRKTADTIEDTNAQLAESYRSTAKTLETSVQTIQSGFGGAIAGGAIGGLKGGIAGAAIGTGLAILGQSMQKIAEAEAMIADANNRLINSHKEMSKSFDAYVFKNGEKLLANYNATLENTIDLENELTSIKLHQQDEELARQYDILQLENQRLENKKKLIQESNIPEAQKISQISAITSQQDFLQQAYDIQAAGAPVEKLKTELSGLSKKIIPITESLQKYSDDIKTSGDLQKKLNEVNKKLTTNTENKVKITELLDSPTVLSRTKISLKNKEKLLDADTDTLIIQQSNLLKEIEKYASKDQLQGEIKSLQERRDGIQKQIISKGQELDLALTTEARIKQSIAESATLKGQTRGIEKVSQLANVAAPAGLQARLDTDVNLLNEKLGGISGVFDTLRQGASVGKQGALTTLESSITQAIKDGLLTSKEFNATYFTGQKLGISADPGFKDLMDKLRIIASAQLGKGTGVSQAGTTAAADILKTAAPSSAEFQVAEYIKGIIKDREINAQELAGLQELLSTSSAKSLESVQRLIAVTEDSLSNQGVVIDRITKIEASLKLLNTKLK